MGEFARLAAEPSEHQKQLWWDYIAIDEPMLTDSGAFIWIGHCPLCDEAKDPEHTTARFDFRRGVMYCENGDNGRSCFKKRSISLSNLLVEMGNKSG